MGTHKGGHNVHRMPLIQILNDLQRLQLVLGSQAVAALGFHGGSAEGHHFIQRQSRLGGQLLFGSLPSGIGGGLDAAAGILNLQIGLAVELHTQLILTPTAKNQMGVGIHQTGGHQLATSIHHGLTALGSGITGANLGDDAVLNADKGIIQKLHSPLLGAAFGGGAHGGSQQADIFNQHTCHITYPVPASAQQPPFHGQRCKAE